MLVLLSFSLPAPPSTFLGENQGSSTFVLTNKWIDIFETGQGNVTIHSYFKKKKSSVPINSTTGSALGSSLESFYSHCPLPATLP